MRRDRDAGEAPRALHQQLPVVAQVGGEEDDDRELAELRGLERERPDPDAQVGAVDLLADARHAREEQQREPGGGDRVAVALEDPEVLEEDDREREEHEPEREPAGLADRLLGVEPVDHDEPEAREHRGERQQVRVRVGQPEAHDEMRRHADAEEDRPVGQRDVGEPLGLLDEDRGEPGRDEQRCRDQREQLAVAGAHVAGLTRSDRARARSRGSRRRPSSAACDP